MPDPRKESLTSDPKGAADIPDKVAKTGDDCTIRVLRSSE